MKATPNVNSLPPGSPLPPKSFWSRSLFWFRWLLLVFFSLVLAVSLFLKIYTSTAAFKRQIILQTERLLGTKVTVSELQLKILEGISLKGLVIKDASGTDAVVVDEFILQYDLSELLRKKLRIKSLSVKHPRIFLTADSNGEWNLAKLISDRKPREAASSPPKPQSLPLVLDELSIVNAEFLVKKDGVFKLKGINLEIKDFDWQNVGQVEGRCFTSKKFQAALSIQKATKQNFVSIPNFSLNTSFKVRDNFQKIISKATLEFEKLQINEYPPLQGEVSWAVMLDTENKKLQIQRLALHLEDLGILELRGELFGWPTKPQGKLHLTKTDLNFDALLTTFARMIPLTKIPPQLGGLPQISGGKITTQDLSLAAELVKQDNGFSVIKLHPAGSIQLSLNSLINPAKQLRADNLLSTLSFVPQRDASVTTISVKSLIKKVSYRTLSAEEIKLDAEIPLRGLTKPKSLEASLQIGKAFGGSLEIAANYHRGNDELEGIIKGNSLSLGQLSQGRLSGTLSLVDQFAFTQKNLLRQKLDIKLRNFQPRLPKKVLPPENLNLQLQATADLSKQDLRVSSLQASLGNWLEIKAQEGLLKGWSTIRELTLENGKARFQGAGISAYFASLLPEQTEVDGVYDFILDETRVNLTDSPKFKLSGQLNTDQTKVVSRGKTLSFQDLTSRFFIERTDKDQLSLNIDLNAAKMTSGPLELNNLALNGRYRQRDKQQQLFLDKLRGYLFGGQVTATAKFPKGIAQQLGGEGKIVLKGIDLSRLPQLKFQGRGKAEISFQGPLNQLAFQLNSELNEGSKTIGENRTPTFDATATLKGIGNFLKGDIQLENLAFEIASIGKLTAQVDVSDWGKELSVKLSEGIFQLAELSAFSQAVIPQLEPFELGGKVAVTGNAEIKEFSEWNGAVNLQLQNGQLVNQSRALTALGITLDLKIDHPTSTQWEITDKTTIASLKYQDWIAQDLTQQTKLQTTKTQQTKLEGEISCQASAVTHTSQGLTLKQPVLVFRGDGDWQKLTLQGEGDISVPDLCKADYQVELAEKGEKITAALQLPPIQISRLGQLPKAASIASLLSNTKGTLSLQAKYQKKSEASKQKHKKDVLIASMKIADVNLPLKDKIFLNSLNGEIKAAIINFQQARLKGKMSLDRFVHPQTEISGGTLDFQVDSKDITKKQLEVKVKNLTGNVNLKALSLSLGKCSLEGEAAVALPQKSLRLINWQTSIGDLANFNLNANLDEWGKSHLRVEVDQGILDYQALSALFDSQNKSGILLSGQGAFRGQIDSSLPEIAAGKTSIAINHTLENLKFSYRELVDVAKINGKLDFKWQDSGKTLTGDISTPDIQIKKKNLSPNATTNTKFLLDFSNPQSAEIRHLTLSLPQSGLQLQAKGQLARTKDQSSSITAHLQFKGDQKSVLYPELTASGKLFLPMEITKAADKDWQIKGKLVANDLSIQYKDKLSIEGINGQLPIKQSGLYTTKTSQAPLGVIPEYELLRTYFLKKESVANFKIADFHYQQVAVKNLNLDVKWENNQLQIGRFRGTFWDGNITGALGADLTGGILRYAIKANLTNVDLKHAFGKEGKHGKSYLTTANLDIKGQGKENFEGAVNVTRIDKRIVDRFLTFLDPSGKNQTINKAREKINRLGKVPKTIHMTARQATMNVVLLLESTSVGLVTTIIPEAVNITSIPIKLLGKLIPD